MVDGDRQTDRLEFNNIHRFETRHKYRVWQANNKTILSQIHGLMEIIPRFLWLVRDQNHNSLSNRVMNLYVSGVDQHMKCFAQERNTLPGAGIEITILQS